MLPSLVRRLQFQVSDTISRSHPPSPFRGFGAASGCKLAFGPAGSPSGMHVPPDGGPGTRDGPAWIGFAGCPAPPAEEEIAASRVPAHRLLAGFGQGRRFNPLPLVAPAACRSWPVHDQEPWRSSPLGQTLRRHSQGLSLCPVARTFRSTLDTPRLRIAEQVITTALQAEAMGRGKHGSQPMGISSQ